MTHGDRVRAESGHRENARFRTRPISAAISLSPTLSLLLPWAALGPKQGCCERGDEEVQIALRVGRSSVQ